MFNFSTNHLSLARGRSTGRARCCCSSTATPNVFIACMTSPKPTTSCLARPIAWRAKSNSADKLYLVIESVRPDTKHARPSTAPIHADGAGENPMA